MIGTFIRFATISDLETIVLFNLEMAMETENLQLDRETVTSGVESALNDSSKGFYLLAEIEGQVIGQLLITSEWSDWRNATIWWIQSVYIKPEFRGKKIFASLYSQIIDMAQKDGTISGIRLYVDSDNNDAQAVYDKLGMHQSHYLMYEYEIEAKE